MSIDFQAPVESAYVNGKLMSRTSDTSTTGKVEFLNATQSNDLTTGAVVVSGGAAVVKNLNVGQNIDAAGTIHADGNISTDAQVQAATISTTGNISSSATVSGLAINGTNVTGSTVTASGSLVADGNVSFSPVENSALTGADAYLSGVSNLNLIYLTNVSLTSIQMIEASADGSMLVLTNKTTGIVTIRHLAGATPANQINTGSGADIELEDGASLWFYYEATSAKWYIVGGSGGGAKKDLSNLTSPTAINQDLIPAADVTYNLGSNANRWYIMRSQNMEIRYTDLTDAAGTSYYGQVSGNINTADGLADVSIDAYDANVGTNSVGLHLDSMKPMIIRTGAGLADSPPITTKTGNGTSSSGSINFITGTATNPNNRGSFTVDAMNIFTDTVQGVDFNAGANFTVSTDLNFELKSRTNASTPEVHFYNQAGTHYSGFRNTNATTTVYDMPNGYGSSGEFLTTDGAGDLSWSAVVGFSNPVTSATVLNGGTISIDTAARYQTFVISGAGGTATLSSTPFGATPPTTDGSIIVVICTDDTNTVSFVDNDAADGCLISGGITLARGESVKFMYISSLDRYVKV